ncbi:hypothetical protein NKR19_g4691 [Coniochaeta hoffmannii]|uniref:Uncharacterized protein n=1 Tax=Coniochaeta hoffmannii TaxID=91930 RepID=A0AA38S0I6_9PEZI|nr:hypothetical protein NKR19_g4691 [Coniochaeta hoffmannii]
MATNTLNPELLRQQIEAGEYDIPTPALPWLYVAVRNLFRHRPFRFGDENDHPKMDYPRAIVHNLEYWRYWSSWANLVVHCLPAVAAGVVYLKIRGVW